MSFLLKRPDLFPAGTNVSAYPESNWNPSQRPPSGAPAGAAAQTVAADASGHVTFTTLTKGATYFAHASVGGVHRYVAFVYESDISPNQDLAQRSLDQDINGLYTFISEAAADDVLRAKVTGDAQPRLSVDADGALRWGPGNASADVLLYRPAAQTLRLYEAFLDIARDAAASAAWGALVSGDGNYRFRQYADGKMEWGSGAAAPDTNLYRDPAGNKLKTDDSLDVGGTITQAGATPWLEASKVRTARVSTGSIIGAGQANVTVTWPSAFADANYTVVAVVEHGTDPTSTSELLLKRVISKAAASCVVQVQNQDAVTANTGTIHAIAIHD